MASPASATARIPYTDLGPLGRYLRACRAVEQPATVLKKRSVIVAVESYIGRSLVEAAVADLERWWDALIDGGLAAATRACRLSIVRDYIRWLISRDLRADDPSRRCERPPTGRGVPRDLDPVKVKAIIRRLNGPARDATELMFWTGTRRAEVAAIHIADDLLSRPDGWWLRVHGKGSKEREVPIPDDLATRLATRTGWLLPHPHDPARHLTPDRVGQIVTDALREGGLTAATPHELRHTAATAMLARTGGDLRLVQVWLGHASPATTAIYTRTSGPSHADVTRLYEPRRRRNHPAPTARGTTTRGATP